MRLGLLGPADGDVASLARAAEFLLNTAKVSRAVYLGADDALERAVSAWAESVLGDDPTVEGVWRRASELALYGTVDAIDGFVRAERARLRLKALVGLPERGARTVEILGGRVAVLIHDKALLDEEDILPASLLVYGKSDGPFVKRIGSRWFLSPGRLSSRGGACVLDDQEDEIQATVFNPSGESTWRDSLVFRRAARLRVQGGP